MTAPMPDFEVSAAGAGDRAWTLAFLTERWGATRMVTRGRLIELTDLPHTLPGQAGSGWGWLPTGSKGRRAR